MYRDVQSPLRAARRGGKLHICIELLRAAEAGREAGEAREVERGREDERGR